MAGAVVQIEVQVGVGAIINSGAIVDHHCQLADYCHVSPGAALAGEVQVQARAWVGIGSTTLPRVTIGKGTTIGAGSVVVSDIPDSVVAYGNPCRVRRSLVHTPKPVAQN